ncbi:Uncharacterised protein [uncultured archaeon]|nr:Uncharacterised protein [uncultured archaeon]
MGDIMSTRITESFNTMPKTSDYGIEEGKPFNGQKMVEYWNALQRWASTFGFQLTTLKEDLEKKKPTPTSYNQGQIDILKMVLGIK